MATKIIDMDFGDNKHRITFVFIRAMSTKSGNIAMAHIKFYPSGRFVVSSSALGLQKHVRALIHSLNWR